MKRFYFVTFILVVLTAFISIYFTKRSLLPKNHSITVTPTSISPTQKPVILCSRNSPYKLNPEFERGISLLYQRIEENPKAPYVSDQEKQTMSVLKQIRNCLDVKYKNPTPTNLVDKYYPESTKKLEDNTEGYFVFDPNSTIDDLKIYVDNRYQEYDDALTALLLAHEVTHAVQLVDYKVNNKSISCVEKEVNALKMELQLVRFFNDEEKQSLSARVDADEKRVIKTNVDSLSLKENSAYTNIKFLFGVNQTVGPMCDTPSNGDFETWMKENEACHYKALTQYLTKTIQNDSFYKKECGL
jgi:hypothetical protein